MTLPYIPSHDSAHVDTYDVGCLEVATNNGRQISGHLAVYDIGGGVHRVPFKMTVGASHPTYHDVTGLPEDLVPWLDTHGGPEILELIMDELAEKREWLKSRDVQGKLIGFVCGEKMS